MIKKFRVIEVDEDGETTITYHDDPDRSYVLGQEGTLYFEDIGGGHHLVENPFKVDFFTGLVDPKGKDIYENDIIADFYISDDGKVIEVDSLDKGDLFHIVWYKAYSGLQWCAKDTKGHIGFYGGIPEDAVVVGNVHTLPKIFNVGYLLGDNLSKER